MIAELSSNAQAILLLTAPLIAGRGKPSVSPLSAGEYRRLARRLRELQREPADLLNLGLDSVLKECGSHVDAARLQRLLGRGFLLSQAVERWRTRAIWVVSRADAGYPQRLKKRLGEDAPPALYGCGDASILDAGGLAVVGSRNVDEALIEYAENAGRLTAEAHRVVVSGGARGIDQAAMRGALQAGGKVVGILADGLEKAAVRREHREALMDGRLALICPYDPAARFNVGHAMQRNKLIYALADAALVVNSDNGKGGTWAGASEQLERLKFVPVYVRTDGEAGGGLAGLKGLGAKPWPVPTTAQALEEILDSPSTAAYGAPEQRTIWSGVHEASGPLEDHRPADAAATAMTPESHEPAHPSPADELFAKVTELLDRMDGPRTDVRVAEEMQVPKKLADAWLKRFVEMELRKLFESSSADKAAAEVGEELRIPEHQVRSCLKRLRDEGAIEKVPRSRPVRYRSTGSPGPLFDRRD